MIFAFVPTFGFTSELCTSEELNSVGEASFAGILLLAQKKSERDMTMDKKNLSTSDDELALWMVLLTKIFLLPKFFKY